MSALRTLTLTLIAAAVPSLAPAQPVVTNGLLTDAAGLTLYTFDNDATTPGRSACINACLSMWTPFFAPAGTKAQGDHSLIARDDGQLQWAYKNRPLYRWYDDKKPGDMGGDGLRQVWHVARP